MNDLRQLVHEALSGTDRWRRWLFSPRDEADGQVVNGLRLVRGPDGRLYAIQIAPKPAKETK